ncbi:MAG: acetylglutamate kinase [Bacillota bacterium]|nr:acetylglutamate kinase [Bacillota bacterium]HHU62286.1 acetylglutamate kinase [Natronincola sp.]
MTSVDKAGVLIEALPFIRRFYGSTIVVKYGGNAMINQELKEAVCQDLVLLKFIGLNPIVVHGGGPEVSNMMKRLGKEPQFIDGLRVTDSETMEIAQMVLIGKVNTDLVTLFNGYGGKAVGINGKDANLIKAKKHESDVDLGFVGDVELVNPELLHTLNREGYIPIVSSVGVGEDGASYNINADLVAGMLAGALNAEKLILLTDVEGIYEDFSDPTSLFSSLTIAKAKELIAQGKIGQGMIPKVEACISALKKGVGRTHIIDGRKLHSILLEIFTNKGIGTMVVMDENKGEETNDE